MSETTAPDNDALANLESRPYMNNASGFSIRAPKGWSVDESGTFGTLVAFLNTQTDQEGANPFGANVNIISESSQGLDLDGHVNAVKDSLFIGMTNYKSTESKKVSVNGVQAQIIGGTFAQGVFQLRNLQLIVVKSGEAYIVTGTVLNSTWDKYKNLMEASLLTFVLN